MRHGNQYIGSYQEYLQAGGLASQAAYSANVLKKTGKPPPGGKAGAGPQRAAGGKPQAGSDANLPQGVYMVNTGAGKFRSDTRMIDDTGGGAASVTLGQLVNSRNSLGESFYFDTVGGNLQGYVKSPISDEAYVIDPNQTFGSNAIAKAPEAIKQISRGFSRAISAAPAPFKQTQPTQKERDEITPPARGLENTIKTSPRLLRERRRRSYLTAG